MVLKMTITRRAVAETGLRSRAPRYRTMREAAARTAAASRNRTDRLLMRRLSRCAPHVALPEITGMRTVATVPAPGVLSKLTPYCSPKYM
jgi:hypothetical protein